MTFGVDTPLLMSPDAVAGATVARSAPFLAEVEARIETLIGDATEPIRSISQHAVRAGGKRLRPQLVWCTEPVSDGERDAWAQTAPSIAAAIELVHTATLVHDDVLDAADTRRGTPTVASQHGLAAATACGDFLFARAFRGLVDTRAIVGDATTLGWVDRLADVSRQLAEGEALQADQLRDVQLSVDDYLARCIGKTGVLFGAAIELGASAARVATPVCAQLAEFGRIIGLAFQIVDDVLDCAPIDAADRLGKLPGADVRDGTITLPMLYAMEADPGLAAVLAAPVSPDAVADVLDRIRLTGALERSTAYAQMLVESARDLLVGVRGHADVARLHEVADRAIARLS